MDLAIGKVRKISLDRPWIHILYERFVWVYTPSTIPNTIQITPSDYVIKVLRAYLENICGLSNVRYYLNVAISNAPDYKASSTSTTSTTVSEFYAKIIIIVEGGVQLPIQYDNVSVLDCNDSTFSSSIYPICYRTYKKAFASSFFKSLLSCRSDLLNVYHIQVQESNAELASSNDNLKKNAGRWISSKLDDQFNPITGGSVVASRDFNSSSYSGAYALGDINADDYDAVKEFAIGICFRELSTVNYNLSMSTIYENVPIITDPPCNNGETYQVAQRILNKDFVSIKGLVKENPLLFIKYGMYLLLLFRYAETKVLSPN